MTLGTVDGEIEWLKDVIRRLADCHLSPEIYARKPARSKATILTTLIIGLMAGPAVSL